MAKKKYYAVKKGRSPGIYETWADCKKQVDGFPGAVYKGFPVREEAEDFMGQKDKTPEDAVETVKAEASGTWTLPWAEKAKPSEPEAPDLTLTPEQKTVLERAKEGENLFITGGAGTGKTVLTKAIIRELSKTQSVMVLASTGVAASHIGGATIHSGLRLGVSIRDPKAKVRVNTKKDPIAFADVLVIDEISMCRIDIFDQIVHILSYVSAQKKKEIQLIVVGDFNQLPPVVRNEDREALLAYYTEAQIDGGAYAFASQAWEMCDFQVISLTETLRQENVAFAKALRQVSEGDRSGLRYIIENRSQTPIPGAIEVCSMNRQVEAINKKHVQLCKEITVSEAEVTENGDEPVIAGDYPFPYNINYHLELGVGLKIMVLKNLYTGKGKPVCVNGDTGVITKIDTDRESLKVKLDKNGTTIDLKKETFPITGYKVEEKDGKKVAVPYEKGTYTQYPAALGYAVTIHKAQGKTFSAANMHLKNIFSYGQLYVALSRVSDVKNLYFDGISPDVKLQDPHVNAFYSGEKEGVLPDMTDEDILAAVQDVLKDQEKRERLKKFIKKLQKV